MKKIEGWALLALLLLLASCASAGNRGPVVGSDEEAGPVVMVENGSPISLRVSAVVGGSEVVLGRVGGLQTRRFRLPRGTNGAMRLVARTGQAADGEAAHYSSPFSLSRGQYMSWRLSSSPGSADVPRVSSIAIFACGEGAVC